MLDLARIFSYRTMLSYVNLRTLSSEILCFVIVCQWSYVFFILPITQYIVSKLWVANTQ